jgi:hypothetical protein
MDKISLIGLGIEQKLEAIKNTFEAESYQFLTTEYKNSKQKLDFICPKGHKGSISWNVFRSGKRCKTCEDIQYWAENKLKRDKEKELLSKVTIEEVKKVVEAEGFTLLLETYSYPQELLVKCSKGHLGTAEIMLSKKVLFEHGVYCFRECICLHFKTRSSFTKCKICDHIGHNLLKHELESDDPAILYFIVVKDKTSGKVHPKFGFTTDLEKRFKYPGSNFSVKIIDSFEGTAFDILGFEKKLMIATEAKRINYDGDTLKGFGGRSECGRSGTMSSYQKAWDKIVSSE